MGVVLLSMLLVAARNGTCGACLESQLASHGLHVVLKQKRHIYCTAAVHSFCTCKVYACTITIELCMREGSKRKEKEVEERRTKSKL